MKKYIPGMIITLFLGLWGVFNADTMALDSDYKNNLLKVDVVKANDGSYKVDLFTQKPYNEPIKVIKKSDTNYYILLPETYHSITSVGTTGDINKVDVKLFPYAGQDLNNGYTKINISTSKPVNLNANVKTAGKQAPQIDAKKLAQLDSAFDGKPTTYSNVQTKPAKPAVKTEPVKAEPAKPVKTEAAKTVTEPVKIAGNPPVGPVKKQEPVKIASNSNNEIEIVTKPKAQTRPAPEAVKPQEPSVVDLEEVIDTDMHDSDEALLEEDAKEQGLTELATGEQEVIPELTRNDEIKHNIKAVLRGIRDNAPVLITILLALIALILLFAPKARKSAKEDVQKEAARVAYEGLDSLKQAETLAISKENDNSYEAGQIEVPAETQIVPAEQPDENGIYEPKLMQTFDEVEAAAVAMAQKSEEEEQQIQTNEDEADVLASESFGENRGLCLVNYDGSIALIGYIEEEIFVIQNFGKITLLNPSIQIRIAEQNDNDTIYIVKTANSKLMVRETKDLIGLEMVM